MSRTRFNALAWVALWAVFTGSANAQEADAKARKEGHRGYVSPINNSRFFGLKWCEHSVAELLTSPVSLELNLSDDQFEKLKSIYLPIAHRHNELWMRLRSPSLYDERERVRFVEESAALLSELDPAMAAVLNAAQRKRLEQIRLQLGDPSAFITESRILTQLGMNDPQRDKLKMIVAEMWVNETRLRETHRSQGGYRIQGGKAAEFRRALQNNWERALQSIIDSLNPDQLATLRELLGQPYDVEQLRQRDNALTPVPWWHGTKEIDAER